MKKEETGLNLRFGIICSLYWILWVASTVFLVPILRQKGMGDGQIGFLLSVRSLAAIGFSPVIASFLDRNSFCFLIYYFASNCRIIRLMIAADSSGV